MNPFNALFIFLFCCAGYAQHHPIYTDVLDSPEHWVVEQQPGGEVNFKDNILEIVDAKGCTVWFKNKLEGNIKIAYDITIIDNDGPHDRVSDMNCFWMANDPDNSDNFFRESEQRAGHFPNYHQLKLYYVGYGGHDNSKTRFRRYDGNIDRPLLPEHDLSDKKFMIVANQKMHIEISVEDNFTTYSRDGEVIYHILDPNPYRKGYFGFRTVDNHMQIENFTISKLN